jgi:hypothetical protein
MFKLGCLPTEQQHPHTIGLSDLAKNDLNAAIGKVFAGHIPDKRPRYQDY